MKSFVIIFLAAILAGGCATTISQPLAQEIKAIAMAGEYPKKGYVPPKTDKLKLALAQLEAKAAEMKITIVRDIDPENSNAWGMSNRAMGVIRMPSLSEVSVDGQWEILAHELAHFFHPGDMSVAVREAYCELVVAEMAKELQHPYAVAAGEFLTQYKEGIDGAMLYGKEIRSTALILLNRAPLPKHLKRESDNEGSD